MAFGRKSKNDAAVQQGEGGAAVAAAAGSFDPHEMAADYNMNYSKTAAMTTPALDIVDMLPQTGSLRRDHTSKKNKTKMKSNMKILSRLSISQSLSQTSTIDEDEEQQYQYHHQATNTSNLYTSNDAALQLQAALSQSLSMDSQRSMNSYNSEEARAGAGAGGGANNKNTSNRNRFRNSTKNLRLPNRYRGFSTSISSLFLDESIVCGALSCCGVLLSSRTEYLLNERNVKRGVTRRGAGYGKEGAERAPSNILGISWIVTIVSIVLTYVLFGFSGGGEYDEYYDRDWADDEEEEEDANNNGGRRMLDGRERKSSSPSSPHKHGFAGIMKLRDYREHVLDPAWRVTSRTFETIKSQFNDEEYTPGVHQQQQQGQHQRHLDYDDYYYNNNNGTDIASVTRMGIILIFLFILGVIGRRRRMRTRYTIQRARTADDHIYYASLQGAGPQGGATPSLPGAQAVENSTFLDRENKYDGACSHTIFGCYPVDIKEANYADFGDDDDDNNDQFTVGTGINSNSTNNSVKRKKKKRKGGDFVNRTMGRFFNCCCGALCKCWCQAFSICALAQEARETRLLVPPRMQRVDLITHQPFYEYAKDVNNVRRRYMEHASRSWMQHYAALSHLSRYILVGFVVVTALVVLTMLLHPSSWFTWADALVLIATFTQSFLVLMVVFGIFHRSDLSFDAVVKFFAVGFCICVPVGVVFEGLLMNGLMTLLYLCYYIFSFILGQNFDNWVQDNKYIFWLGAELFGAYFVAALVEELCKYYGFRFVEHPDLIFLTGLDRSAEQAKTAGGVNAYKFDSQLVSEFSRSQELNDEIPISRSRSKIGSARNRLYDDEEYDEPELRTVRQQAAAITTGMISVAVGLACAENFMYVFFLGGSRGNSGAIWQELMILLFRSIFPIHALAAAMQSINMIRKFIEEPQNHLGVGRIIFPAIILHGTFDAILMCITTYIEQKTDEFYANGGNDADGPAFNALVVNIIAWVSILGLITFGFGWYMLQNRRQMKRLALIEIGLNSIDDKATSRVLT
ncbi:hypothetical protein ACHAXM_010918 [Skeletonema potamos]